MVAELPIKILAQYFCNYDLLTPEKQIKTYDRYVKRYLAFYINILWARLVASIELLLRRTLQGFITIQQLKAKAY